MLGKRDVQWAQALHVIAQGRNLVSKFLTSTHIAQLGEDELKDTLSHDLTLVECERQKQSELRTGTQDFKTVSRAKEWNWRLRSMKRAVRPCPNPDTKVLATILKSQLPKLQESNIEKWHLLKFVRPKLAGWFFALFGLQPDWFKVNLPSSQAYACILRPEIPKCMRIQILQRNVDKLCLRGIRQEISHDRPSPAPKQKVMKGLGKEERRHAMKTTAILTCLSYQHRTTGTN